MPTSLPVEITYIGGPTAALSVAGITFIVDPTFDAAGKEYRLGGITLKKVVGPAIDANKLGRIDIALVSHDQHPDNLDDSGREMLKGLTQVITTVAGSERLGNGTIGLAPWQTTEIPTKAGVTLHVTATPARHGPVGIEPLTGDVIGFVISAGDEDLVYVTGDTVWYEGTAAVARRFNPRVVLLFGGAARTRGPFHLTMDTNDAVEAAVAFKSATLVPVHHDGWTHFTQSQDDLISTFTTLGLADRLHRVEAGKPLTFR